LVTFKSEQAITVFGIDMPDLIGEL